MNDTPILCETADGVATVTLNRPEAMNAFGEGMRELLLETLQGLANDGAVRCIVITGAGRAFSAGGDIANMAALQDADDADPISERIAVAGEVTGLIRALPQPVIAAVNGPAAGGGMNLALACDIRLGSDKALFAQSFVKIGLVPDWGGFGFLTRLVGTAKAMELMMTGGRVDAQEAHRLGLLNHVYPSERFAQDVAAFVRVLADSPAGALTAIKRGVYLGAQATAEEVVAYEREEQARLFLSADSREGMRAFLEKRPPVFGKA